MKVLSHLLGNARNSLLIFLLILVTARSGILGCGETLAGPELHPAQMLRQRFPEQAGAVLTSAEHFISTAEGFALRASAAPAMGARRIEVTLPPEGRGSVRLRAPGGFEVEVRELGVEGEGAVVEQAVVYRRAGGTSFWTARPGGVEEWLHLDAGAVRAGEPVVVWEVEGATVQARGEVADLVDAGGVVRLSVTAPVAYAAGGRRIRAWMAGRASQLELRVEAEEREVLVDPLWTTVAPMTAARAGHTATLLPSGQVLIVGGQHAGSFLASAELYNLLTNRWTPAGSLSAARSFHTATLLPNGQVLVVGGDSGGELASTELYNPETNSWTSAASLASARGFHTATLLPSGQVFVAGGGSGGQLASAELYDPAVDSWKPADALTTARAEHTATLLPSGHVLVVGGVRGVDGFLTSAEEYDSTANSWTPVASLAIARSYPTATLLPSGQVLVVGGNDGVVSMASAEVYDPAINSWKSAASLGTRRSRHTATLLPNGQVLVAGGYYGSAQASVEVYDFASNSWKPGGSLNAARYHHTATLMPSGQVLVVGGISADGGAVVSVDLYNPPCSSSADCMGYASGECDHGLCDVSTSTCLVTHKLDGTHCKGGVCIAGGCFTDATSPSSSASGTGGGASTGSSAASTSSSSSSATGVVPSANGGSGGGGSASEIHFRGGACGIASEPAPVGPWLGLGLLLTQRRRPRRRGQVRPGE